MFLFLFATFLLISSSFQYFSILLPVGNFLESFDSVVIEKSKILISNNFVYIEILEDKLKKSKWKKSET